MILLVQIIATARAVLDCDNVQENLREDKRNTPLGQNYGPSSPGFLTAVGELPLRDRTQTWPLSVDYWPHTLAVSTAVLT